ncbi:DNA/RNA non-specific endonuclease [Vibrio rhizosphaerae]|uniref:DNA/RNA non-specific endonuclease n=1 Tax=Vibrio rhizosphaerae TaxID=398736 RepID=A0ABU4J0N7_9VIBR|nr:DNA/RNA non-specific endonuclease [Vibrio rhizosphaerae]MDW6094068.1 DNA/RNA non-specific endonuclease [Vibrio rhizosphaerae]
MKTRQLQSLSLSIMLVSGFAYADCFPHDSYGTPGGDTLLCHESFEVGYNRELREPDWTAYQLTKESVEKSCSSNPDFRPDPAIPESEQANDDDYDDNVWDKGHLAPRANVDTSCNAELQSVYYTNAAPQHERMNRVGWRTLEGRINKLVRNLNVPVYVITGVTHNTHEIVEGGTIEIPDRFWKAIYIPSLQQSIGFIYKNEELLTDNLFIGVHSLAALEYETGIKTFDISDDEKVTVGAVFSPLYK